MLSRIKTVKVSDTTDDDSSNSADGKKNYKEKEHGKRNSNLN